MYVCTGQKLYILSAPAPRISVKPSSPLRVPHSPLFLAPPTPAESLLAPHTRVEPNPVLSTRVEPTSPSLSAPHTCEQGTQTSPESNVRSIGVQTIGVHILNEPVMDSVSAVVTTEKLAKVAQEVGLTRNSSNEQFILSSRIA